MELKFVQHEGSRLKWFCSHLSTICFYHSFSQMCDLIGTVSKVSNMAHCPIYFTTLSLLIWNAQGIWFNLILKLLIDAFGHKRLLHFKPKLQRSGGILFIALQIILFIHLASKTNIYMYVINFSGIKVGTNISEY